MQNAVSWMIFHPQRRFSRDGRKLPLRVGVFHAGDGALRGCPPYPGDRPPYTSAFRRLVPENGRDVEHHPKDFRPHRRVPQTFPLDAPCHWLYVPSAKTASPIMVHLHVQARRVGAAPGVRPCGNRKRGQTRTISRYGQSRANVGRNEQNWADTNKCGQKRHF
jgi:hypothetical protein